MCGLGSEMLCDSMHADTPTAPPGIVCTLSISRGDGMNAINAINLSEAITIQDTDNCNVMLQRLAARLEKKFKREFVRVKAQEEQERKRRMEVEEQERKSRMEVEDQPWSVCEDCNGLVNASSNASINDYLQDYASSNTSINASINPPMFAHEMPLPPQLPMTQIEYLAGEVKGIKDRMEELAVEMKILSTSMIANNQTIVQEFDKIKAECIQTKGQTKEIQGSSARGMPSGCVRRLR